MYYLKLVFVETRYSRLTTSTKKQKRSKMIIFDLLQARFYYTSGIFNNVTKLT